MENEMTQPEYMTIKRQALVLQAIAKEIAEDESVYYMVPRSCDRAIKAIMQCSADLVEMLKKAEQSAKEFRASAQEPA